MSDMKKIYILVYEDVVLSSAAAPLDILSRTNDILRQSGRPPAFTVELVSEKVKNVHLSDPAQFICQHTLDDIPALPPGHNVPMIMVPAWGNDWEIVRNKNQTSIAWLREHYAAGTEVASVCLGSYFLAEAGLLNGISCTSHWSAADDMRRRFPEINLQPDTVLTDEQGIYTGGGAFSSLNLILYLVEKFCGHDTGVLVSKHFSIHRDHINQAHFSVFNGLSEHDDKLILGAQSFIEHHFDRNISVEQVAAQVNMSKRNFIRRFKKATHNTPLEYIQRVKIEAAKKALETSNKSIQTLMHEVGYEDNKTFRDVFKRFTGITPKDYRHKYGRHQDK